MDNYKGFTGQIGFENEAQLPPNNQRVTWLVRPDGTAFLKFSDGSIIYFASPALVTSINTRLTYVENNEIKIPYFETIDISVATAGSLTVPTGATIVLDEFKLAEDAVLSTLSGTQPTFESPLSGGSPIGVTLDGAGNWTVSGVYPSLVALIYVIKIELKDFQNLDQDKYLPLDETSFQREPLIVPGTNSQYWRGDKSWQTLDKTAVGLPNVQNLDQTNPANIVQDTTHRFTTDVEKGIWNSNVHFRGKYLTLAALQTAVPVGLDGDYGIVDPGAGTTAKEYIWDAEEGWVLGSGTGTITSVNGNTGPAVVLTTTNIAEGTNLYFTNARAINAPLTGYTSGAGVITASDNPLTAIQKLNGNIGALITGVSSVNGGSGAVTITVTGTPNEITVSAGGGLTPTISLPNALIFTGKTITGGTYTSPTFTTPVLGAATGTSLVLSTYLEIAEQSVPATPTNAVRLYAAASNALSWVGENGFTRTLDGTANTANRIYTLPDVAGTFIVGTGGNSRVALWSTTIGTNTQGSLAAWTYTTTTGETYSSSTNANVIRIVQNANAGVAARSSYRATSDGTLLVEISQYGGSFTTSGLLQANLSAIGSTSSVGFLHYITTNNPHIFSVNGTGIANEIVRFTSTAVVVKSGINLQLGNAAVTGLVAGALAALTNATIVLYDSAGQAYRIPCII